MKCYVACVASLISAAAWSAPPCTANSMRVDVCRAATAITDAISPELPVRLTESLVLHNVEAKDNQITMSAFFDYTEAYLLGRLRRGVSLDALKQEVRNTAILLVCKPDSQLEAFINLGGQLQMIYLFSDAAHFLTVDVKHCNPEPVTLLGVLR